jgi:hypothetical protein
VRKGRLDEANEAGQIRADADTAALAQILLERVARGGAVLEAGEVTRAAG